MSTSFDEIRDLFLSNITDFDYSNLTEAELNTIIDKFLISSIAVFDDYCNQDLTNRDDIARTFNVTLTDLEKRILSKQMIIEWINPKINNLQLLKQNFGNRDFQLFSDANKLNSLINLKQQLENEIKENLSLYTYRQGVDL